MLDPVQPLEYETGLFQLLLKTRVILILNFTRPHAITYTNSRVSVPRRRGTAVSLEIKPFIGVKFDL